jgi:hypothetical protein
MEGIGGKRKMKGTYFFELPELPKPSRWERALSAINHWIWKRQEEDEDMDLGGDDDLSEAEIEQIWDAIACGKVKEDLLAGKLRKVN